MDSDAFRRQEYDQRKTLENWMYPKDQMSSLESREMF